MIESVFARAGLAETHGDSFRNIVSLRVSENLFDDLSDDPVAWDSAMRLELETKPNFYKSPTPIIHRPFEEAAWNDAIGYPFKNWMRSRDSDGTFGVWYGADTVETTVYETAYHWRANFLADAGFLHPGIQIERKIYRVQIDAALIDLRPSVSGFPALIDAADYTLTQQVGFKLHREGHPGLVTRSARCEGDVNAVFNAAILTNPRQVCYLTYTTTNNGIAIEREPGKIWFETTAG